MPRRCLWILCGALAASNSLGAQPAPGVSSAAAQSKIVSVDSEAFELVASRLLLGGKDSLAYPYRIKGLTVEVRPDTGPTGFDAVAGGRNASVPVNSVARRDTKTIDLIAGTRTRILARIGIPVGKPLSYPKCRGTLAVSPAGSAPPDTTLCPQTNLYYVTVGLPIEGEPEALVALGKRFKPSRTPLAGEVWTVIVGESYAGKGGQNWFQHAWLLVRNPATRRLELADTLLIGWEE